VNENFIVLNDPGASTNKGGGSYGGKPQFVSMSPYCAKDDFGECDRLAKTWGHSEVALESAWVADPDGAYLLGEGARELHGAAVGTEELKYKKALYKTLAMVGYFAQRFAVPNKSKVSIGVLLPFNEYRRSQEEFSRDLKIALKNFSYCGRTKSFELTNLFVRPEGAGIFIGGVAPEIAKNGSVLVVNAGFRNITGLFHEDGKLSPAKSETCDYGYRWLVSRVAKQSGYKDEGWIFNQIFSETGDREVKDFAKDSLRPYWSQVASWLGEQPSAKHIVFAGGTSLTLEDLIKSEIDNNLWPQKLHDKVLKCEANRLKAFLYMDLYGVYMAILSAIKRAQQ
jgi:hypothetical protein